MGSDTDSWKAVGVSLDFTLRTCQLRAGQCDVRAEMLITGGRVANIFGPWQSKLTTNLRENWST